MTNRQPAAQAPTPGKAMEGSRTQYERSPGSTGFAGPVPNTQGSHAGPPRVPLAPPGTAGSWDEPEPDPAESPPVDLGRATPIVTRAGHPGCRFLVRHYDGERLHEREVSEAEMRQIDPRSVDLYVNEPEGRIVLKSADGEPQEVDGWPGLVGQEILRAIQSQPGIFLSPRMLADLTGIRNLADNGTVATNVMRLRAFLGEQGGQHRLIQSRRAPQYGIRWPRNQSWMWVTPVLPDQARSK